MLSSRYLSSFARSPLIVAEIGVNHNGSLSLAEKLIRAAADTGADVVKFQTFTADECASRKAAKAEYQLHDSAPDQFSMLKRLELDFSGFASLKKLAESLGISFLSTPDGENSLQCLVNIGSSAIKIASGEVDNLPFLATVAATGLPVILSTGMSRLGEVERAVIHLQKHGCTDLVLLHCTSEYPATDTDLNLRAIETLRQAFALPVGFSDHSEGAEAAIAATALGVCLIEKHFTLDRTLAGPDHQASMEPGPFAAMVNSVRRVARMLGHSHKKATAGEEMNRKLVRRSICAARDLKKYQILTAADLCCKRPAAGISGEFLAELCGREMLADLGADEPLHWQIIGGKKTNC